MGDPTIDFDGCYNKLSVMVVPLVEDPAVQGVLYIQKSIAQANSFIEEVSVMLRQISQERYEVQKKLMLMKKKKSLLDKNDIKLSELIEELDQLELYQSGLRGLEQACEIKISTLKTALSSVRFQWSIVESTWDNVSSDRKQRSPRSMTTRSGQSSLDSENDNSETLTSNESPEDEERDPVRVGSRDSIRLPVTSEVSIEDLLRDYKKN